MPGEGKPRRRNTKDQSPKVKGSWKPAWLRIDNTLIQTALFFGFLVVLILLMTIDTGLTRSSLSEEMVGAPTLTDIKASRAHTYEEVDEEATTNKRNEAAASVPSIYDHHLEYRDQRLDQVRKSFGDMRRALQEAKDTWLRERANAAAKANTPDPLEKGTDPAKPPSPTVEPKPPTAKEIQAFQERTSAGLRAGFDLALQEILPDEDFAAFVRDGFSASSEQALVNLVNRAMSKRVVSSLRLLEAEGGRGITLRRVRYGETQQETRILDVTQSFMDVEDARREINIFAPDALRDVERAALRRALINSATRLVRPNTLYNPQETERRREDARLAQDELRVVLTFQKGQNIVDRGHIVTARHLKIVRQIEGNTDRRLTVSQILVGTLLLVLILVVLVYVFGRQNVRKFQPEARDLTLLGCVVLLQIGLLQGLLLAFETLVQNLSVVTPEMLAYGIPVALGAMIVRMVQNSESALLYAIALGLIAGMTADQSLSYATFVFITSLAGARAAGDICHRMDLVKAGFSVGMINALSVGAFYLLRAEATSTGILWAMCAGFLGGLLSGILVNAILPLVENLFGYTTDIKLLELADLNHPALKELIMKAPGSYHHSVVVGTLAKEAAEAIHANPLLARVGSYYHDIGKGKNPQYFAENQHGNNPHDKLKPNMSALIIKAHVKDGLELARQHNLPPEIHDFIAMHHGTTLISYFYHRAKSMEDPDIPEVDEKDYRYPGPKPQTRETAIVMLADGIEAASRAMPDPSHARIKGLVQTMINKLFADGQLDECDLTLKDLNAIAKAFIMVLSSMYHSRPQYPGQDKNSGSRQGRKTGEHKRKSESTTGERKRRKNRTQSNPVQKTVTPSSDPGEDEVDSVDTPTANTPPNGNTRVPAQGLIPGSPQLDKSGPGTDEITRPRSRKDQERYIRMTGPMVAISREGKDEEDVLKVREDVEDKASAKGKPNKPKTPVRKKGKKSTSETVDTAQDIQAPDTITDAPEKPAEEGLEAEDTETELDPKLEAPSDPSQETTRDTMPDDAAWDEHDDEDDDDEEDEDESGLDSERARGGDLEQPLEPGLDDKEDGPALRRLGMS